MTKDDIPGAALTYRIIGLAMQVHRDLGPGLLESIYERCLCYEFAHDDMQFQRQVSLAVRDNDVILESGCIADIIVDNQALPELKAIERMLPVHEAQLLTCMRLAECRIGLLINFNTVSLTDGIKRRVL